MAIFPWQHRTATLKEGREGFVASPQLSGGRSSYCRPHNGQVFQQLSKVKITGHPLIVNQESGACPYHCRCSLLLVSSGSPWRTFAGAPDHDKSGYFFSLVVGP